MGITLRTDHFMAKLKLKINKNALPNTGP